VHQNPFNPVSKSPKILVIQHLKIVPSPEVLLLPEKALSMKEADLRDLLTLEDGTDRLFQNVGTELPLYTA
jgi:hypothetical protein